MSPKRTTHLNEEGSFAVIMALTLTLILTVFAFVLDLGFFAREKNRCQAAAETTALGIAETLYLMSGPEDIQTLAADILARYNMDLSVDAVDIELGFYDAYDEYEAPLGTYQDFSSLADGGLPLGQPANAVLVTIGEDEKTPGLSGMNEARPTPGAAVAYVPKLSMVAGEDIDFAGAEKLSLSNGSIYAHGTIDLAGDRLDREEDHIRIAAGDALVGYTRQAYMQGPFLRVRWINPTKKPSEDLPEISLAENHRISVADLAARLKKRADKIYNGPPVKNDECYKISGRTGYFDFTRNHDGHRIVYIDYDEDCTVILTPYGCSGSDCVNCPGTGYNNCSSRTAFGNKMADLTIVATCNITIPQYKSAARKTIFLGGKGYERLHIIALGNISFTSGYNELSGVDFISAGGFTASLETSGALNGEYAPPAMNFITILSEGSIKFNGLNNPDFDQYNLDLSKSLHSPPLVPPTLGRLTSAAN